MTVKDMRFGGSKTYEFSGLATFNAAFSNEAWYKLIPKSTNPPLDFFTDIGDFDVEIGNTWFTSQWDMLDYYMMALRIRRKNDNNPGAELEANGYQIIIRSHFGITSLQESVGFWPFEQWVEDIATEPVEIYGATDYNWGLSIPCTGPYESAAKDFPRRAQDLLYGPSGKTQWDGTTFKFTGNFVVSGAGMHPHTLADGDAIITFPATSTVIPVIGSNVAFTRTVGASGIILNVGEALWYNLKVGFGSATDDARWVIVAQTAKNAQIPPHWVMIASYPVSSEPIQLGSKSDPDTGDVTVAAGTGWTATGGYITVRKVGKLVFCRWNLERTGANIAANADSTLFTLPAQYVPVDIINATVETNISTATEGLVQIFNSGVVLLQNHDGINTTQSSVGSALWFTP
jgi:hypothetical protein